MRMLWFNGSPNANGNTATLARVEHAMSRFAGYYGMEYLASPKTPARRGN